MMKFLVLAGIFIATVNAECPNMCSGHGSCGLDDVCTCYDNWGIGMGGLSGDCSERICPYDIAFVDAPDVNGEFHKYAECSGRGICDRGTGECQCFDGYSGQGCQRTTCPNDCSGHGTCEFIEDLTFGQYAAYTGNAGGDLVDFDYNMPYYRWDKGKTRGCVCDAQYGDYDCSKRLCPHGNDVMDPRENLLMEQKYHAQRLTFEFQTYGAENQGKTFALSVKSDTGEWMTTSPINYEQHNAADFALSIRNQIRALPIVDFQVKVEVEYPIPTITHINITFTGDIHQGDQDYVVAHTKYCGDGCNPKIDGLDLKYSSNMISSNNTVYELQDADFNNYECGRHGKCDYSTGECQCYDGYEGKACTMQSALI